MKQNNNRGSRRRKPEDYIKAAETLANWPTEKVHLTALRERKGPIKGKSFVKTDIKGVASWMTERQSSPPTTQRLGCRVAVGDDDVTRT